MFKVGDLIRHKPSNDYGIIIEILHSTAYKVCWLSNLTRNWVIKPETIEKVS
jgi:hypothetical protein